MTTALIGAAVTLLVLFTVDRLTGRCPICGAEDEDPET